MSIVFDTVAYRFDSTDNERSICLRLAFKVNGEAAELVIERTPLGPVHFCSQGALDSVIHALAPSAVDKHGYWQADEFEGNNESVISKIERLYGKESLNQ